MTTALVFPGQGSQALGMLSGFADEPLVRDTFRSASDVLAQDLWALAQEGPQEALDATINTQPLLLTAGVAVARLWAARGGALPTAVAGHSLGEFTALVVAEALDFEAAVALVRERAERMQAAVPPGQGAMAAVLGLDDAAVAAACAAVSGEGAVVVPANLNAPGQVVIAGHAAAVESACKACREAGAKRAMPLSVSVPSHSPLMASAAEAFGPALGAAALRDPRVPIVQNVVAEPVRASGALRAGLLRQLVEPVRWSESVARLVADGVTTFVECGPGRVLGGLVKRIERGALALATESPARLDAALAEAGA